MAQGTAILGFPRSGTTLLRRLLGAHPQVLAPAETGLLGAAARFLQEDAFVDGGRMGVISGLMAAGFEEEDVLARTRGLVEGFFDTLCARAGREYWVEKSAGDVFHLDGIEQAFGDHLRYLAIVRHGADVVCSVQELVSTNDRYLYGLHPYLQRNPRPSLAIAQAWADTTQALVAFVARHPERALLLRYEDLVADPLAQLQAASALMGVDYEAGLISQAMADKAGAVGFGDWKTWGRSKVGDQSVGRWKGLSRGHLHELGEVMNSTLAALGYPPLEGRPPGTRQETLRRQRLALAAQALKGGRDD